jgi:hypothetical protein
VTAGRFREVDLDLLADYVGGALAGTDEEAEVARLVAEDPAWEQSYELLVPAVDTVRSSLADWGSLPATMPAEIADRLIAALDAADPVPQPETGPAPTTPAVRRLTAVSGVPQDGVDPGRRTRATRRSRQSWSRLAGAVAVAAAVAAFAGFGVSQLVSTDGGTKDTTALTEGSDSGAPALSAPGAGAARALLEPAGVGVISSGTDYGATTLAGRISALTQRTSTEKSAAGPAAAAPDEGRIRSSAGLQRLVDRNALATCLDAVAAAHGSGSLTVNFVDYASFEARPALVIAFADQSGARWAWVTGPECGVPGSGADTRYQARVG